MKLKTTTLTGRALNYAVALAEGFVKISVWHTGAIRICRKHSFEDEITWAPVSLGQGDEIIDREMISTQVFDVSGPDKDRWNAYMPNEMPVKAGEEINGPDRRTAAMRCWVMHKLGAVAEIPDELLEET